MRDTPLKRKPVILIIMDGYGLRKANIGNAVNQAKKPHLDAFMHDYPMTTLAASGEEVGFTRRSKWATQKLVTWTRVLVEQFINH